MSYFAHLIRIKEIIYLIMFDTSHNTTYIKMNLLEKPVNKLNFFSLLKI